jgi:hypothetical protein
MVTLQIMHRSVRCAVFGFLATSRQKREGIFACLCVTLRVWLKRRSSSNVFMQWFHKVHKMKTSVRPSVCGFNLRNNLTYCDYIRLIRYDIYLTAIELTPGGSSTSHIYTQTTYIIQRKENLGSAGRAPSSQVIPWHLPYNWGKNTENPQLG